MRGTQFAPEVLEVVDVVEVVDAVDVPEVVPAVVVVFVVAVVLEGLLLVESFLLQAQIKAIPRIRRSNVIFFM